MIHINCLIDWFWLQECRLALCIRQLHNSLLCWGQPSQSTDMSNYTCSFFQGLTWTGVNSSIFLDLGIISKMTLLLFFHLHFTSCLSTFSSHFKVPDLSPDCFLSPFQEGFPFPSKVQDRTPLQQSAIRTRLPTCDLSLSSSAEKLGPFGKVSHTTASFPQSLRWVLTKGPEMCHYFRKRGWEVGVFRRSRITLTTHGERDRGHKRGALLACCLASEASGDI